ncbi:MAG TPA: hypothetical protein VMV69_09280 [Pirellulales bacterium]|nr:hypothetical protein [Pirellulales bacterium]
MAIRDFGRRLAEARSGGQTPRYHLVLEFAGVLACCVRRWRAKQSKRGAEPVVCNAELVQNTLLEGCADFGTFTGDSALALQKWLLAILRNVAIDAGRARVAGKGRQVSLTAAEAARSPAPTPLDLLLRDEREQRLQGALDRLSERELMILMLFAVGCADALAAKLVHAVTVVALRSQRQRIVAQVRLALLD